LIQITGSSTTDDAQITKNEKSSLQKKNSTGKKKRKLENKNCSQIFFLSFLLPVLIPAARIVTRGYAPLGVTAACVFPAPFRAQYLLEYCFS